MALIPHAVIPSDSRGSWDMGIVMELLDAAGGAGACDLSQDGGVIILAGQHRVQAAAQTASLIAGMPWALTVVTSDEEALFPVELLPRDEKHTTWGMYHARAEFERVIPIGTPPGTAETLAEIEAMKPARMGDVFFAGQDTHARRHDLIEAMRWIAADPTKYGNLTWAATTGFREGLSQRQYLEGLRDTRVAPCPSGPHSLDSFRLYEALAAGALPVIEKRTPHGDEGAFWDALFGSAGVPAITVTGWEVLPMIVERLADPVEWCRLRDEMQATWADYRAQLDRDFAATIERLRS